MAKQIYDEQLKNGYPGLVKEAQILCKNLAIQDVTREREKEKSKGIWKEIIKSAVKEKNGKELKEKITKLEKLESMQSESFGLKDYLKELSLEQARVLFRVRTRMVKCKLNQSSQRANKAKLWRCDDCGNIDSQSHILHCPAYQDLRTGKDLKSDIDVANYFKQVLSLRDEC